MCDQTYQPTYGKLALALSKAQAVMDGAKMESQNPAFKRPDGNASKYANLESVWEACRKPLTDNELAVIQSPSSVDNIVTVETILLHSSGEMIKGVCSAKARDASPQAIGSAITYLRRYGLAAMVGVYQEDDDGNLAQPVKASKNGSNGHSNGSSDKVWYNDFDKQVEGMKAAIAKGERTPEAIIANIEGKGLTISKDIKAKIMALGVAA